MFTVCAQYNSVEYRRLIKPMFHLEPCVYGHRILSHAASVFAAVRHMPPPPRYDDNDDRCPAEAADPGAETATGQPPPASAPRRAGQQSAAKKARSQPEFDFRSRAEKRLTFTLVFQTLKCEIRSRSVHIALIISVQFSLILS